MPGLKFMMFLFHRQREIDVIAFSVWDFRW